MVSLTYRTQDLVKIDNESFELQHIFKCDRNILVLPHQFTKSVLGKVKSLTSVRQQGRCGQSESRGRYRVHIFSKPVTHKQKHRNRRISAQNVKKYVKIYSHHCFITW